MVSNDGCDTGSTSSVQCSLGACVDRFQMKKTSNPPAPDITPECANERHMANSIVAQPWTSNPSFFREGGQLVRVVVHLLNFTPGLTSLLGATDAKFKGGWDILTLHVKNHPLYNISTQQG